MKYRVTNTSKETVRVQGIELKSDASLQVDWTLGQVNYALQFDMLEIEQAEEKKVAEKTEKKESSKKEEPIKK